MMNPNPSNVECNQPTQLQPVVNLGGHFSKGVKMNQQIRTVEELRFKPVTIQFDRADRYVRSAPNLDQLKTRLDRMLDEVLEYLPYFLPVFDVQNVPEHLNGVSFCELTNHNRFLTGWTNETPMAVVSWDQTRFLVIEEESLELSIVDRHDLECDQ